jgi:hypothetical protein
MQFVFENSRQFAVADLDDLRVSSRRVQNEHLFLALRSVERFDSTSGGDDQRYWKDVSDASDTAVPK